MVHYRATPKIPLLFEGDEDGYEGPGAVLRWTSAAAVIAIRVLCIKHTFVES